MLDGIADLFGDVFSEIYDPAQLVKSTRTQAEDGDITEGFTYHDCFLHPVTRSESFRQSAGFADDQMEVIVLAKHIEGLTIDTDDKLTTGGRSWQVLRAKIDGPKSQWKCLAKEIKAIPLEEAEGG